MLTADLVEVRRRGNDLSLRPLAEPERERGLALAEIYLGLVKAHLGRPRAELLEACRAVPAAAREKRLAAGLMKLCLDRCEFEAASPAPPEELRAELFTLAAAHRRALAPGASFDRAALLTQVASPRALDSAAVEEGLYADLPEAHRLVRADLAGPRALFAAYEAAGAQAVLLRAVRVEVRVTGAAPAAFRQLFRKLKFLRLLHSIQPLPGRGKNATPGYLLTIDGPFSLFDSVSKYGLSLALAYPAIAACGRYTLEADVRWGKERRPLRFLIRGGAAEQTAGAPLAADDATPTTTRGKEAPLLPPEVETLRAGLAALGKTTGWRVRTSTRLIDLPGAGVLVPDLELEHLASGRTVLCEVLGFWSREAVWRRIELCTAGTLPFPMIFAVSKHLRVSEEALPADLPAALLVYAHSISPRTLLDRAAALIQL